VITTGRVASIANVTQDDIKRYDEKKKRKQHSKKRENKIRQSDKVNCTDYIPETIGNKAN